MTEGCPQARAIIVALSGRTRLSKDTARIWMTYTKIA